MQEQLAAMEYKKSAMLNKRSTIYNDYTTVVHGARMGYKQSTILMTAPLYKNKKSAMGYNKSTINNDCTTVQEQKVSHGV